MSRWPVSRRTFLTRLAGAALAGGVGWTLSGLVRDPEKESDRVRALRDAASRPGPAEARLRALHRPRHPARPLPFAADALPGFSRETHFVHYSHHYLEYLWRWEIGERKLLRAAERVHGLETAGGSTGPPIGDRVCDAAGAIRALCGQARHDYETCRQGAAMVLLHDLYWSQLARRDSARDGSRDTGVSRESCTDEHLAAWLAGNTEAPPLWLFLTEPGLDVAEPLSPGMTPEPAEGPAPVTSGVPGPGLLRVFAAGPSYPLTQRITSAIDTMDHAWLLDYQSLPQYLQRIVCLLPDGVLTTLGRLSRRPAAAPGSRADSEAAVRSANLAAARRLAKKEAPSGAGIGPDDDLLLRTIREIADVTWPDSAAVAGPVGRPVGGPAGGADGGADGGPRTPTPSRTALELLDGLRRIAGPGGYVTAVQPEGRSTHDLMLLFADAPAGLPNVRMLAAVPGRGEAAAAADAV